MTVNVQTVTMTICNLNWKSSEVYRPTVAGIFNLVTISLYEQKKRNDGHQSTYIDSLQKSEFKIWARCKVSYQKSRLAYIRFKEDI
jgi:hypothetical protein